MNWDYITGFFDADGSVTLSVLSKDTRRTSVISFHNNELNVLISIQLFIESELSTKGHICMKKKAKEHHNQQYDLKFVGLPKCIAILKNMNTIHMKKKKRFEIIEKLKDVTPRNGKYTEEMLTVRKKLEEEFFRE